MVRSSGMRVTPLGEPIPRLGNQAPRQGFRRVAAVAGGSPDVVVALQHFKTTERDSTVKCEASLTLDGVAHKLTGAGNGPIDAFVRSLGATSLPKFEVLSYSEHSLGKGSEARAVSYIQIKTDRGPHALRRRHRHEHRARVDQGDRQRAQPHAREKVNSHLKGAGFPPRLFCAVMGGRNVSPPFPAMKTTFHSAGVVLFLLASVLHAQTQSAPAAAMALPPRATERPDPKSSRN